MIDEERNYNEHKELFDKVEKLNDGISDVKVAVAIVNFQTDELTKSMCKLTDSMDKLKDGLIDETIKESNQTKDKLFGLLKYLLIGLLSAGIGSGTVAWTGEHSPKQSISQAKK